MNNQSPQFTSPVLPTLLDVHVDSLVPWEKIRRSDLTYGLFLSIEFAKPYEDHHARHIEKKQFCKYGDDIYITPWTYIH